MCSLARGTPLAATLFLTASGCARFGYELLSLTDSGGRGGASASPQGGGGAPFPPGTAGAGGETSGAGGETSGDAGVGRQDDPPDAATAACLGAQRLATVTITHAGASALTEYPVEIALDTDGAVSSGLLEPTCANLFARALGQAVSVWIPPEECGKAGARVWLEVERLEPGALAVEVSACASSTGMSPQQVFPYFEGFDGAHDWSTPPSQWSLHGDTTPLQTGDGTLVFPSAPSPSPHSGAIQSRSQLLRSGQDVLGVRYRAQGGLHDDFEIGVAAIDTPEDLWNGSRDGSWATMLHFAGVEANFGNGTRCDLVGDTPYLTNDWYAAEFSYRASAPAQVDFEAVGPGGRSYSLATTQCGDLPEALPLFVTFDHSPEGNNTEVQIDWIYVRPKAPVEPSFVVEY